MFTVAGFAYPEQEVDAPHQEVPLKVISAGHYMLIHTKHIEVRRLGGRRDYQIIYVRSGVGVHNINGQNRIVTQGNMVIYHPEQPQIYYHNAKDNPEIYWLHFSGNDILPLLQSLGFDRDRVFEVNIRDEYAHLFDRIIQELQLKRSYFSTMADALFRELLHLMARQHSAPIHPQPLRAAAVEEAVRLFHLEFAKPFEVSSYAAEHNMSACWFTRQFRKETGVTPQQYLTGVRMNRAQELLCTSVSISEISAIVGYSDPLYFSRVFKHHTGRSPREYHKMQLGLLE